MSVYDAAREQLPAFLAAVYEVLRARAVEWTWRVILFEEDGPRVRVEINDRSRWTVEFTAAGIVNDTSTFLHAIRKIDLTISNARATRRCRDQGVAT